MDNKRNNTYSFEEAKKVVDTKINESVLRLQKGLKKNGVKKTVFKARAYA